MHSLLVIAQIVCYGCTIAQPPSPNDQARLEYQLRQERLRQDPSPLEEAQKRYLLDQRRLLCADHPQQC
jgi:hypothetical protein